MDNCKTACYSVKCSIRIPQDFVNFIACLIQKSYGNFKKVGIFFEKLKISSEKFEKLALN